METLSLDPLVFSIKDFLSAYEADEIVRCGLAVLFDLPTYALTPRAQGDVGHGSD